MGFVVILTTYYYASHKNCTKRQQAGVATDTQRACRVTVGACLHDMTEKYAETQENRNRCPQRRAI